MAIYLTVQVTNLALHCKLLATLLIGIVVLPWIPGHYVCK
eukprot:SAG31_NODE_331_length_17518_cov_32.495042_6_plen_40_part_00